MNKTLIIVRHAHRDKSMGREVDNGLSKKGRAQAQRVAEYYEKRFENKQAHLISSPKKRCVETLDPLAEILDVKVEISELLQEQQEDQFEAMKGFQNRIKKFHEDWLMSKEEVTIACSHGDWIPVYLSKAIGTPIELKKGGWAELEYDGAHLSLRWLLQSL